MIFGCVLFTSVAVALPQVSTGTPVWRHRHISMPSRGKQQNVEATEQANDDENRQLVPQRHCCDSVIFSVSLTR